MVFAISCSSRLFSGTAGNRPRPTHFVALRLPDEHLWQQVQRLQQEIWPRAARICAEQGDQSISLEDWDLAFQMALYPASRFHFSLFVIDLKKEEQLQLAKECLSRWFGEDVPQTLQGRNQLEIELAELACFDKKEDVLFLQPDDQSATEMSDLNRTLQARLSTCMLAEKQRPTLQPHATIMKKSQVGRKLGQKLDANRVKSIMKTLRFPREAWSEYNKSLGKYAAREVQLLDMRKPKDGYFEVEWEGSFR
ncbi:unnamed protein product [Durusdinium trenchii]